MSERSTRRPRRNVAVLRRDPRAERSAWSMSSAASAPSGSASAMAGSQRIDPRALRAARDPVSGRIRIDRSSPAPSASGRLPSAPPSRTAEQGPGSEAAKGQAAAASAVTLVVIEHPRSIVIAVPELDRGRLTALDRDLLGAARLLADAHGGAVLAVVEAGCIDDLGAAGADRVVRLQPTGSNPGQIHLPAAAAAALVELAQQYEAAHLLFADAPGGGADLGRRVAARMGVHPAVHVKLAGAHEAVSLTAAGRTEWVRKPPRVMLVEAGCAEPVSGRRHEARELPAALLEPSPGLIDLGAVKVDRSAVPLAEAELILSAGAGVTDWTAFHALAARLGAVEAGSRVVCDLGHLPRDRQVGASGSIVEPRVYVALGISGAPQHLQGIARCERVVAVNADAHAPMIQRADLAIVADVQRVMPALAALIEQQAPRG